MSTNRKTPKIPLVRRRRLQVARTRHSLMPRWEIQGVSSRVYSVSRGSDDGVMTSTTRIQHRYDHRLRELVQSTGDVEHAIQRGVPRSTARGWLTATRAEVVTVDIVESR